MIWFSVDVFTLLSWIHIKYPWNTTNVQKLQTQNLHSVQQQTGINKQYTTMTMKHKWCNDITDGTTKFIQTRTRKWMMSQSDCTSSNNILTLTFSFWWRQWKNKPATAETDDKITTTTETLHRSADVQKTKRSPQTHKNPKRYDAEKSWTVFST